MYFGFANTPTSSLSYILDLLYCTVMKTGA